MKNLNLTFLAVIIFCLSIAFNRSTQTASTEESADSIPVFKVDPFWPKPLPDGWLIGQVSGMAVDKNDHIWIIHRPGSLGLNEVGPDWNSPELPFTLAPPVIEFDREGNMIRAWGGPGEGYEWPESEHGIFVDSENDVWLAGAGQNDHQVLKFTKDGKFLLQIGRSGETGGSNNKELLGKPTEFDVDNVNNEIYIADGYVNRRVIVFDATTGEYKRHWGAYGKEPEDIEIDPYDPDKSAPEQFNTVHSVRIADDGLVYICDRGNNRIQVFEKDGKFLFEEFLAEDTKGYGSTWDIDFSQDKDQRFAYVADGTNQRVWILERKDLKEVGHFGRIGRNAGQFVWVHNIAVDSQGNIYTAEVYTGKRIQKFIYHNKSAS